MSRRSQLFWAVLAISFTGSLPPGVLNTGIAGLIIEQGISAGFVFGLGAILSEMAVVRLALTGVAALAKIKPVHRWIYFALSALLLSLTFFRSGNTAPFKQFPFVAGLGLSLLNPLHLPFWLGWRAALRSRKILGDTTPEYNLFAAALGTGTALAFLVYGLAGQFFAHW